MGINNLVEAISFIFKAHEDPTEKRRQYLYSAVHCIAKELEEITMQEINESEGCCATDRLVVKKVLLEEDLKKAKDEYVGSFKKYGELLEEYKRISTILEEGSKHHYEE